MASSSTQPVPTLANLWQRYTNRLYLSPAERTAVRLVKSLIASGVVAGLTAVIQYATSVLSGGTFAWTAAVTIFLSGAFVSMLLAIEKYASAHADDSAALKAANGLLSQPGVQQSAELDIESLAEQVAEFLLANHSKQAATSATTNPATTSVVTVEPTVPTVPVMTPQQQSVFPLGA